MVAGDKAIPEGTKMRGHFTLEFWRDGNFYVGRLLEVPGVFSQGAPWRNFGRISRMPTT
jgi:hypothetical protein